MSRLNKDISFFTCHSMATGPTYLHSSITTCRTIGGAMRRLRMPARLTASITLGGVDLPG